MPASKTETKTAKVMCMLKRRQGASIEEIAAETEWKPHSVRAFLTGMRKKGYSITRTKEGEVSRYRLADEPSDNATPAETN